MVHVEMASLPSSSQGSDVADFSTSDESDPRSLMSASSSADSVAMDLDASPAE